MKVRVAGSLALSAAAVLALLCTSILWFAYRGVAQTSLHDPFNQTDHLLIARALAEGRTSEQFILACDPNVTDKVAADLKAEGATVLTVFLRIGYIRAEIPFSQLGEIAHNPGIELMDVLPQNQFDFDLAGYEPIAPPNILPDALPTPGPKTPPVNPFTGLQDMGAPQFLHTHPTYDGRGTVVGILEPADPFAPGLRYARDLNGHNIPKFVSYKTHIGPFDLMIGSGNDNRYFGWVNMRYTTHTTHGRFFYNGKWYRAPYEGVFQIGVFSPDTPWTHFIFTGAGRKKSNASLDFVMLWDEAKGSVWFGTRSDGDFRHEHVVHEFAGDLTDVFALPMAFGDWSKYGAETTGGAGLRVTPVTVQIDRVDGFIHVEYVGLSTHASMVAGSATGSGLFHGAFDGVAPGAQLAVSDGYYPYLLEGLVELAESHADVISVSFVLKPYANEGGVFNAIVDRIVHVYNISIVFGAGNSGPAVSGVEMPSTSSRAISAGGYISEQTARYDEGVVFPNMAGIPALYSARGPAGNGAMKPDLLAPTEWLTSSSSEAPPAPFRQTKHLPRGYEIGGGTSQAAPTTAGAIALLVSAAKQQHLQYDAQAIKLALITTGANVPPFGRFEIGGGLINVPAAWAALQRLSATALPQIDAVAPVRTTTSGELVTPNSGPGLFEREGWHTGMHATRTILYTLGTPTSGMQTYAVRILGDHATFQAPPNLRLEPGSAVGLPMVITARTPGIHSAIVALFDAQRHIVVDERLCTIVVAERFSQSNAYTIVHSGAIPHPGLHRYFLDVPPGAMGFSVRASVPPGKEGFPFDPFSAREFLVVRMPDGKVPALFARYLPINEGQQWAQAFPHPAPGVWEVDVQNVYPSDFRANPQSAKPIPSTQYTLTTSVYRVALEGIPRTSGSRINVILRNEMAPLRLSSQDVALVHARRSVVTLSPENERAQIVVQVPAHTEQVYARLLQSSIPGTDVHIYLFNCARNIAAEREPSWYQGRCVLASSASSLSRDGIASTDYPSNWVSAMYPSPTLPVGRWVVAVDATNLTVPVEFEVQIGTMSLSEHVNTAVVGNEIGTNREWTQSFTLPPGSHIHGSEVISLGVRSPDVVTICQQTNAGLITTMERSKPEIIHRAETVWSVLLP